MSEHLRALALAATPGPWGRDACRITAKELGWARVADTEFDNDSMAENAAFIAAANPKAILALLDELADHERAYALLFKECGELRKDADRYRWLVAQMLNPSPGAQEETFNRLHAINPEPENAWQVDAAIDAAKGESHE
jgi:hypothetical protein